MDPDVAFAVHGGFVYTDPAGQVIRAVAFGKGSDVYFQPPRQWRPEFTAFLVS